MSWFQKLLIHFTSTSKFLTKDLHPQKGPLTCKELNLNVQYTYHMGNIVSNGEYITDLCILKKCLQTHLSLEIFHVTLSPNFQMQLENKELHLQT